MLRLRRLQQQPLRIACDVELHALKGAARWLALIAVAALAVCRTAGDEHDLAGQPWRWSSFGVQDGLPSELITHICEARDGVIWVATGSGLAWYDGFRWVRAQGAPRLPVWNITPDQETGVLVIMNKRLYRGDQAGFHSPPLSAYDEGYHVNSAVPAPEGGLLLVTYKPRAGSGILVHYKDGRMTELTVPGDQPSRYAGGLWYSDTGPWLNTSEGLFQLKDGRWQLCLVEDTPPRSIRYLAVAGDAGFAYFDYYDAGQGLWTWSGDSAPSLELLKPEGYPDAMTVRADGMILAAYDAGRVQLGRRGKWDEVQPLPPQLTGIRCLLYRSNGDLLVGTDHGFFVHHATDRLWERFLNSAPDATNRVYEILLTRDGEVWTATSDGIRIRSTDGSVRGITEIDGRSVRYTTGIAQDGDGNIWLTSGQAFRGAFRFDGSSWSYFGPEQGLIGFRHKVRIDRKGRPWFLGLEAGLPRIFNSGTGAAVLSNGEFQYWTTAEGLSHDRVYAFAEGAEGEFWFGTWDGLSRYKDGDWTHWSQADGLKSAKIWTLAVDSDNRLWFADKLNGIGYIDRDRPYYLNTEDGLIGNKVQDIRADPKGGVWLTCTGGVMRLTRERMFTFPSRIGIGRSNLWPILPTEDRVWIGTTGAGVAVLNRSALERCEIRISIDNLVVDGDAASLTWHVAARDALIRSDQIETRYRLDDDEWSEWSPARSAVLAVSAGRHPFTVEARSRLAQVHHARAEVVISAPLPIYRHPALLGLVAILAALSAITWVRRRKHQAALGEQRRLLSAIVEGTTDAIAVTDLEGRYVLVNSTVGRWLGKPVDELIGRHESRMVSPEIAEMIAEQDSQLLHGHEPQSYENTIMVNNIALTYRVVKTLLRDDRGSAVGLIGVAHDITDLKRAEEALKSSNDELERRVAERTAALSSSNDSLRREMIERRKLETQLRQAQKMEAIGRLAGGVAHDFNNILTTILGTIEVCRKKLSDTSSDDVEMATHLAQIDRSSRRAADLTRQLLAFSRQQTIKPETLDPNQVLREMEPMLRRLIRDDIRFEVVYASDVLPIHADAGQIEQVLMNLTVNACDAMLEGGRLVIEIDSATLGDEYAARNVDVTPGRYVRFAVSDTGHGMDRGTLDRIFEPFFTTKPVGEGTGLGLATVHGIVKQAGGNIEVDSEPGRGSTFKIHFPAMTGSPVAEATGEARETPIGGSETILFCEDDHAVRELISRALEREGYAVLTAEHPSRAVELAERHDGPIHLVITDVIMPEMNGRQLADAVSASRPDVRVLYISGYPADVIADHGALDHGVQFLQKPFNTNRLLRCVSEMLAVPA